MPGRRTGLLAIICVVLAAICRFALFDLIEFKYDEAQVSTYALDLVRQHIIPQTSILTSGGFHNPPLMVYLTAIPLLVSPSPLVVTGFFTALNALATGGLYLAGRRLFGNVAGLAAAILYAIGPLAVHYSRKIWAPDAMPPFTVLLFAGLALGLGEGRPVWLAAALIALAVLVQLHQAAIVLIPATVVLLVAFSWRGHSPGPRRRGTWGGLLAGLAGFIVLLLPYGTYELQHRFTDIRGMASQVGAHPTLTFVPWHDLWWLTAGWDPQLFFAALAAQEHPPLAGSNPLDWAVLALGLAGAAVCVIRLVRPNAAWLGAKGAGPDSGRVAAAALLLMTFLPPVAIMRSAAPVYPHYLVFLLPLLFLLVGIGISAVAHLLHRLRRAVWVTPLAAVTITAVLALTSIVRLVSFDQRLTVHTTGGDYGTPLRYSLQAATALSGEAVTGEAHRSYIMATDGDTLAVYGYLSAAGVTPAAALVQPEQALIVPSTGTGGDFLFTSTTTPAYQALRAAGATAFPLPRTAPAYTVVRITGGQRPRSAAQLLPAAQSLGPFQIGPGLLLTAVQTSFTGQRGPLNVALAWTVVDPTPFARQPVKMFVHLYDAARHTVAQEDALGAPASTWHRGDQLLTWFAARPQAPLAPGRYTLVAGIYIVDGFHAFPVRGPNGEDLGGEIPLGVVTVAAP